MADIPRGMPGPQPGGGKPTVTVRLGWPAGFTCEADMLTITLHAGATPEQWVQTIVDHARHYLLEELAKHADEPKKEATH